ncbi:hypothetical protein [Klebsiella pneumoniae]|nr:hypothetical protein [Klebsiella pneumoniae]
MNFGNSTHRRAGGCERLISVRWKSPATALRYGRRPASPSATGTVAHRRRAIRRSDAGLRHTGCRKRVKICQTRKAR